MQLLALALLALTGCLTDDEALKYYDRDGDGSYVAEAAAFGATAPFDCDDDDAAIHPGATEICDGVDNDCDQQLDDGDDRIQVYLDADGDGYGISGAADKLACTAETGWSRRDDDCDDTRPDIHPQAAEACDGIDNDCDEEIDDIAPNDQSAPRWYLDADGDGFGNEHTWSVGCSPPEGYVESPDDCDDSDSIIHPGARELCGGKDEDCDGLVDDDDPDLSDGLLYYADADSDGFGDKWDPGSYACVKPVGTSLTNDDCDDADDTLVPTNCKVGPLQWADFEWLAVAEEQAIGDLPVPLGDVTGDGVEDLVITANLDDLGGESAGAYYIIDGTVAPGTHRVDDAFSVLYGTVEWNNAFAIAHLSAAESVGPTGVVIGDAYLDAGKVWLVHHVPEGTSTYDDAANATITASTPEHRFGKAVVWTDHGIAVGAPGAGGAVYMFPTSTTGSTSTGAATHTITGTTGFGEAIVEPGDLDGDGVTDVLISSSAYDGLSTYGFLGPLPFKSTVDEADLTAAGSPFIVAVGDATGDGRDDFVTASPWNTPRGVWLYDGNQVGILDTSAAVMSIVESTTNELQSLEVTAGDFNGDGSVDLVLGLYKRGTAYQGEAHVFLGALDGTLILSDSDRIITGEAAEDRAGDSVRAVPDRDGDGQDELLLGASASSEGALYGGATYLILGSSMF